MKGLSNLPQILAILVTLNRYIQALGIQDVISKSVKAGTQELADIKDPIVGGVTNIASSQCDAVKAVLQLKYDQMENKTEPDLNSLSLDFICPEVRLIFNLSTVADAITHAGGFNLTDNLVIFMHGFTDNPGKENFAKVSEAFHNIGHTNILALDASKLINWLYLRATTYVQFIGEKLAEALAAMVTKGLLPKNIHLVGHSLGAHISAFACKRFTELTGLKVGRLSGLDPAGPCFTNVDDDNRIKKTDADFVIAIHTDAGVYGISDSVGHLDFFPNGGSQQTDCFWASCSHSRAVTLFAESVEDEGAFLAQRCKDWDSFKKGRCYSDTSLMGLGSEPGVEGDYFLQTNETAPYGIREKGIVYQNRDGVVKSITNLFG